MTAPIPPRPLSFPDSYEKFEAIVTKYGVPRDELVDLVGSAQATEWHVGYRAGRQDRPTFDETADSVFEMLAAAGRTAEVAATLAEFDANRAKPDDWCAACNKRPIVGEGADS